MLGDRDGLAEQVEDMTTRFDRSCDRAMKPAAAARADLEHTRHQMTLEALVDVETGRLFDHGAVTAWADSLGSDQPLAPPDTPSGPGFVGQTLFPLKLAGNITNHSETD